MQFSSIKERLAGLEAARANLLAVVQRRGGEFEVRCVRRGCGRTVEADKAFHHGRDGFCPDHRPPNARPVAESLARVLRLLAVEKKAAAELARLSRLPPAKRQPERERLIEAIASTEVQPLTEEVAALRADVARAKRLVADARSEKTRGYWRGLLARCERNLATACEKAERAKGFEVARLREQLAAIPAPVRCTFIRAARRAA